MIRSRQSGFTLVELLISVVILGILVTVISPIFSNALAFMEGAKRSEVQLNNQKLAAGMLSYAQNIADGKLPPQVGSNLPLYAQANDLLFLELSGTGVPPSQINSTGYGIDAVKRYQVVHDLEYTQPMFFSSGDTVTLFYDVGVIYQTKDCARESTCGTSPPSSGESPELDRNKIAEWDVKGGDYAPVMINTLALQKSMLRVTIGRLNRLSDRISSNFYAKARMAESSGVNHFAGENSATPSTVGPCWSGWENLSATNTLASIGLDSREFGRTAWGGSIEYCRDYKISGGSEEPPFYAALRINKELRKLNPVGSDDTKNVIVTF